MGAKWNDQPYFNSKLHPDKGLEKNYCRNLSGYAKGTWCYYGRERKWEACNIPMCIRPTGAVKSTTTTEAATTTTDIAYQIDNRREIRQTTGNTSMQAFLSNKRMQTKKLLDIKTGEDWESKLAKQKPSICKDRQECVDINKAIIKK